jgi:hypothetical protein
MLRHYAEGDSVLVKLNADVFEYQNEFQGNRRNLITTPSVHAAWNSLLSSWTAKRFTIIAGLGGYGKTSIPKELAQALGVRIIYGHCSD